MCWDISLHTDIEIIKKTFPQLRDERRQLDYNYDYLENVQAITFPKYPILYKDCHHWEVIRRRLRCFN